MLFLYSSNHWTKSSNSQSVSDWYVTGSLSSLPTILTCELQYLFLVFMLQLQQCGNPEGPESVCQRSRLNKNFTAKLKLCRKILDNLADNFFIGAENYYKTLKWHRANIFNLRKDCILLTELHRQTASASLIGRCWFNPYYIV